MDAGAIEFDYLKNDADLVETFIKLADIERSLDREAYDRALANASEGLETIRHFLLKPLKITPEQFAYLSERCSFIEASIERVKSATQ